MKPKKQEFLIILIIKEIYINIHREKKKKWLKHIQLKEIFYCSNWFINTFSYMLISLEGYTVTYLILWNERFCHLFHPVKYLFFKNTILNHNHVFRLKPLKIRPWDKRISIFIKFVEGIFLSKFKNKETFSNTFMIYNVLI